MKILTRVATERLTAEYYDRGFHDAVESLVRAIDSKDKVVLGNGMSFVGMDSSAPVTIVGHDVHLMNGLFTMNPKFKRAGYKNNVKICGKL